MNNKTIYNCNQQEKIQSAEGYVFKVHDNYNNEPIGLCNNDLKNVYLSKGSLNISDDDDEVRTGM